MEVRDQAYQDFKKGMKYKDIAAKYGVSLSAVKSWATRYWKNGKVATSKNGKSQPKNKKTQPRSRGAPLGNKNAVGNHGGAPLGNQNNLKHGGYTAIYLDTLDEDERELYACIPDDEEDLLRDQIAVYTIRERRLMKAINKLKDAKGDLLVSSVSRSEVKREFGSPEEKEQYDHIREKKIEEEKISYLGHEYQVNTVTENTIDKIQRLESELTRVQSRKTNAIEALHRLRTERLKNGIGDPEAEDGPVQIYIPDNRRD